MVLSIQNHYRTIGWQHCNYILTSWAAKFLMFLKWTGILMIGLKSITNLLIILFTQDVTGS